LLAGVAALHLALFLVVFPAAADDGGLRGFINLAYQDSGRTLAGSVPYCDFLLEYPPGLLVFMVAPRLFAASQLAYRAPFFVETAALDLVILLALHGSARAARLPVARALGLYTLALVLLGPIAAYRLDLAPAALVAAAVLAWQRDRPTLAAIALAAGAASKVYPLVFLPPLIADCWTRGRRREARGAAIAAILTLVALIGPALIAGTGALRHALRFQTGRHTEVEALWATPPLLLRVVLGDPLAVRNVDRAFVILGPGDALGRLGHARPGAGYPLRLRALVAPARPSRPGDANGHAAHGDGGARARGGRPQQGALAAVPAVGGASPGPAARPRARGSGRPDRLLSRPAADAVALSRALRRTRGVPDAADGRRPRPA